MEPKVSLALRNIRGGLTGVIIYLMVTAAVFFIAFMTALGNDSSGARAVLALSKIFFLVANPLWAVPLAWFLGGCLVHPGRRRETSPREEEHRA